MNIPPPRRNASPKAVHAVVEDHAAPAIVKMRRKSRTAHKGVETAAMPNPKAQFASFVSCNSFGTVGALYVLLKYSSCCDFC